MTQKINELVFRATIIDVINRLSQTNTIRFSQSDRVSAGNDDIVIDAGNKVRRRKTASTLLLCIVFFACANSYAIKLLTTVTSLRMPTLLCFRTNFPMLT